MAVGAGSIKRASKLNTEATEPKKARTTKTAAKPVAEETAVSMTEEAVKAEASKKAAEPQKEKATPAQKAPAPKTTTKKSSAKKPAAEKPVAVNKAIADEAAQKTKTVEIPVEPDRPQEAVEKKNSMNQVCHLTEALPIHLL